MASPMDEKKKKKTLDREAAAKLIKASPKEEPLGKKVRSTKEKREALFGKDKEDKSAKDIDSEVSSETKKEGKI